MSTIVQTPRTAQTAAGNTVSDRNITASVQGYGSNPHSYNQQRHQQNARAKSIPPSMLLIGKKHASEYIAPALYRIGSTGELVIRAIGSLSIVTAVDVAEIVKRNIENLASVSISVGTDEMAVHGGTITKKMSCIEIRMVKGTLESQSASAAPIVPVHDDHTAIVPIEDVPPSVVIAQEPQEVKVKEEATAEVTATLPSPLIPIPESAVLQEISATAADQPASGRDVATESIAAAIAVADAAAATTAAEEAAAAITTAAAPAKKKRERRSATTERKKKKPTATTRTATEKRKDKSGSGSTGRGRKKGSGDSGKDSGKKPSPL